MPTVKSLDDLKQLRETALNQQASNAVSGQTEIIISLGTPAIAAGACDTKKAILDFIDVQGLAEVVVRKTGSIGLDSFEPIVQVRVPGLPEATYGNVTPEKAVRLMQEHVLAGQIVVDLLLPIWLARSSL
jgi:NADP-reducing hydrogenase subunit HndB